MTTTVAHEQHSHRLPFAAAAGTAAVIVGLAIAGVAISNGNDSAPQAPAQQGPTAQDYAQYQHYYAGMTHGRHLDRFHYVGSGGRVQMGQ